MNRKALWRPFQKMYDRFLLGLRNSSTPANYLNLGSLPVNSRTRSYTHRFYKDAPVEELLNRNPFKGGLALTALYLSGLLIETSYRYLKVYPKICAEVKQYYIDLSVVRSLLIDRSTQSRSVEEKELFQESLNAIDAALEESNLLVSTHFYDWLITGVGFEAPDVVLLVHSLPIL